MKHLSLCSLVSHHSCISNRVVMTSKQHFGHAWNLRFSELVAAAGTRRLSLVELRSLSRLCSRNIHKATVQATWSLKVATCPRVLALPLLLGRCLRWLVGLQSRFRCWRYQWRRWRHKGPSQLGPLQAWAEASRCRRVIIIQLTLTLHYVLHRSSILTVGFIRVLWLTWHMDQVRLIDHQVALSHLGSMWVYGVPVRLELLVQALQLLSLTLWMLLGAAHVVVQLLAQHVSLARDWALWLWHLLPSGGWWCASLTVELQTASGVVLLLVLLLGCTQWICIDFAELNRRIAMIIHGGLQALLLDELMDIAFIFLIDFLKAVELLLLKLAKALFLVKCVVFRCTEVFSWPKSGIPHLQRIISSKVFVRVWNCFIQILVDEPRVFFFLLFLGFCMLLQKEILFQDLLVKSQYLFR